MIANSNGATYYTGGNLGVAYKTNGTQSSTGNITGIYDLRGNAAEYVAGYNKAYTRTGSYFGGAGGNTDTTYRPASGSHFAYNANGTSTKYITAYNNSTSIYNATNFLDFTSSGKDVSHIGDGIHEVWVSSYYGWFSDYSFFAYSVNPFFERSGLYYDGDNSGVFYSIDSYR